MLVGTRASIPHKVFHLYGKGCSHGKSANLVPPATPVELCLILRPMQPCCLHHPWRTSLAGMLVGRRPTTLLVDSRAADVMGGSREPGGAGGAGGAEAAAASAAASSWALMQRDRKEGDTQQVNRVAISSPSSRQAPENDCRERHFGRVSSCRECGCRCLPVRGGLKGPEPRHHHHLSMILC